MENLTQNWELMTYPFENIKLPYNFTVLAPYIDAKTSYAHYDRLLVNYINQLNQILETRPDLQSMTLQELIAYAESNQDQLLLRNAGGVYNHFFYFDELRPATGQIVIGITPQATKKVSECFGSWKNMKEQFTVKALSVFGSGYAWLVKTANGNLDIVTTANQATPLTNNVTPILCVDVWEHAYYLQHLNDRQKYLDDFWNIVDWVKFSERLN